MFTIQRRSLILAACALLGSAMPAIAQNANYGELELAPNFNRSTASLLGNTSGDLNLLALAKKLNSTVPAACQVETQAVSKTPDHILNLTDDLTRLRLTVNSNGKPATVMVQSPDGQVSCGTPGQGFNADSVFEMSPWEAGQYKIWVASEKVGQQYRLSARE